MENNKYPDGNIKDKVRAIRRHTRNFIMVSGVFLFSLFPCLLTDTYASTVQLTIVHSNNINGHLFPCPT